MKFKSELKITESIKETEGEGKLPQNYNFNV